MQMDINQLKRYIPILPKLISPFISTASKLKDKICDINIKKTSASDDRLWKTCMYVCRCWNSAIYTENDCTCTLILVTNQAKSYTRYKFTSLSICLTKWILVFVWNQAHVLCLPVNLLHIDNFVIQLIKTCIIHSLTLHLIVMQGCTEIFVNHFIGSRNL